MLEHQPSQQIGLLAPLPQPLHLLDQVGMMTALVQYEDVHCVAIENCLPLRVSLVDGLVFGPYPVG